MSILDQIIEHKRKEVEESKSLFPVKLLEKSMFFESPTISLKNFVLRKDKSGIIAEIKRKSPSKGMINQFASVEKISTGYIQAGASALSVLTDKHFFGGGNEDLTTVRKFNSCPILRKDFVLDEYQIMEAKSIGADAILLIAAVLTHVETKELTKFAHQLGLEILLEVHTEEELLSNLEADPDLVGVNNRNLKTLEISIDTSKRLSNLIPDGVVKISESGIDDPKTILELRQVGFKGFLIGQTFMQQASPENACKEFIAGLRKAELKTT